MFGQSSTFGKPNNAFGGFGQPQQQQQPQTSLFGTPSTPAFGQQPQQQQTPLFGGSTLNSQPSAFGTPSNSLFGAKPASTPLFGGATSTPTFGGGQTSAFGQSTPSTSFSFGGSGTTSAFGQPQQNSTFGGFGQPAANTNDVPDDFTNDQGMPIVPIPTNGSSVPFTPQQRGDAPQKRLPNGTIDAKSDNQHIWHSIASQRDYWNISPEELRWQDYQQNRKQGTAPPTNTFSFGAANTSTPSAFGTPQTNNVFGASTPQNTSLFGSNTQNNTGLFGTSKPASPFGTPAASTSFGAAPATSTFSFGAATPAPAANPFGTSAPSTSFGATSSSSPFGTSTAQSNPFGQPQQPAASTPGAFGSSFGAQTPKFSFGANTSQPSTSLFGQPAAPASTPAFGSTPAAPASNSFSFGQTPAAAPAFGAPQTNQQPQQSTSLFGGGNSNAFGASKPLFGSTPASTSLFGSTPAPATSNAFSFGKPAAAPGTTSLFGSGGGFGTPQAAAPAAPAPSFGFGSGNTSLFGNNSQPQQNNSLLQSNFGQQAQPPPNTNDSPYGNSSLFAPSPAKAPFYTPVETAAKIKPAMTAPIRSTPKSTPAANRLRFNNPSSPALHRLGSPGMSGRQSPALAGIANNASFSPNAFTARPSVKRLELDRRSLTDDAKTRERSATPANGSPKIAFDPELESATPRKALTFNTMVKNSAPKALPAPVPVSRSPTVVNDEEPSYDNSGYTCSPPVSQLNRYNVVDLAEVDNFSVTHKGFGSVRWLQPVDLTQVGELSAIPGRYIQIDRSNLLFYDGDEEEMPRVGEGLNTSAIVTLEESWPTDRATGKPAKTDDANRLAKHTAKLKRICNQMGGQFVDFDTKTGAWTFKLPDFSLGRSA